MTALRRTGTVVRGLIALAVLLALVAGVPIVLVATVGNPIPADWSMTQALSNQAILDILACVAWVFWAQLVVCVVVETIAEIRLATSRSAEWLTRVPGTFAGQQALARALVQAVVAIGVTGTVVGSATPWPAPADAAEPSASPPVTVAASAPIVERSDGDEEHDRASAGPQCAPLHRPMQPPHRHRDQTQESRRERPEHWVRERCAWHELVGGHDCAG